MMDYYSLLVRSIAGLGDQDSVAQRHNLYARGRKMIETHLGGAIARTEQAVLDRELAAFDDACRRIESTYRRGVRVPSEPRQAMKSDVSIRKLANDVLLNLFGDEGLASLRAGNWKFISVVAPVFGFIADVSTVFTHAAPTLFVVCGICGVVLTLPIVFRTKYCHHCAVPSVFAFILVIAFGFVTAAQKAFGAEEGGVTAKYVPGVPEIQEKLAEILGIQKAMLTTVTSVQSDTSEIKQQLADATIQLTKISAQLEANNALVRQLLANSKVKRVAPGAREQISEAVETMTEGAAAEPRYAKALELLKAGKPVEAEPLLLAVAKDKAKLSNSDVRDVAAAYRNLASIASVSDPARAREFYAYAARLDPSNIEGAYQNGWFQEQAGDLNSAQSAYARVIARAKPHKDELYLYRALLGTGDIQIKRLNFAEALGDYQRAEAVASRLVKFYPSDTAWQRELALAYGHIGQAQEMQHNLTAALRSDQASLNIIRNLAQSNPNDTQLERDLSASYIAVGDVQRVQLNLEGALAAYQEALFILRGLTKSDPGNTEWQDGLSTIYGRVGYVQESQGKYMAALTSFQSNLAILDRLTRLDPDNAQWKYSAALTYEGISSVYFKMGELAKAEQAAISGRSIIDQLLTHFPREPQYLQVLFWFRGQIGLVTDRHRVLGRQ